MRLSVIRTAAATAALSMLLSGCDLLYSYMNPFAMDPNMFPMGPSTLSEYGKGSATIEFTQARETRTITLNRVTSNSTFDSYLGAFVTWENDDGWSVTVNAYASAELSPGFGISGLSQGDVTINQIDGHEFWTAGSYTSWGGTTNPCAVAVSEVTSAKVAGRVNCQRIRWTDGLSPGYLEPSYVDGQEPFDVNITFEAEPKPPTSTS